MIFSADSTARVGYFSLAPIRRRAGQNAAGGGERP